MHLRAFARECACLCVCRRRCRSLQCLFSWVLMNRTLACVSVSPVRKVRDGCHLRLINRLKEICFSLYRRHHDDHHPAASFAGADFPTSDGPTLRFISLALTAPCPSRHSMRIARGQICPWRQYAAPCLAFVDLRLSCLRTFALRSPLSATLLSSFLKTAPSFQSVPYEAAALTSAVACLRPSGRHRRCGEVVVCCFRGHSGCVHSGGCALPFPFRRVQNAHPRSTRLLLLQERHAFHSSECSLQRESHA